MSEREQYLWVEKYRPQKIDDCILPEGFRLPAAPPGGRG